MTGFISNRKEATTGTDRHKIQKTVQPTQEAGIKKAEKTVRKGQKHMFNT